VLHGLGELSARIEEEQRCWDVATAAGITQVSLCTVLLLAVLVSLHNDRLNIYLVLLQCELRKVI